jgi:hypothetical protein
VNRIIVLTALSIAAMLAIVCFYSKPSGANDPSCNIAITADTITIGATSASVTASVSDFGDSCPSATLTICVITTTGTYYSSTTGSLPGSLTASVTGLSSAPTIVYEWVDPPAGYTDTNYANNYGTSWWHHIGDTNGDTHCNMVDIQFLINRFMISAGNPSYVRSYDIAPGPPPWPGSPPPTNNDGGYEYYTDASINMLDIQTCISYFLQW